MTKLSYLHEPGVLHNLSIRYQRDKIYVRGSPTSVSFIYSIVVQSGEEKRWITAAMGGFVIILYRTLTYDRRIPAIS